MFTFKFWLGLCVLLEPKKKSKSWTCTINQSSSPNKNRSTKHISGCTTVSNKSLIVQFQEVLDKKTVRKHNPFLRLITKNQKCEFDLQFKYQNLPCPMRLVWCSIQSNVKQVPKMLAKKEILMNTATFNFQKWLIIYLPSTLLHIVLFSKDGVGDPCFQLGRNGGCIGPASLLSSLSIFTTSDIDGLSSSDACPHRSAMWSTLVAFSTGKLTSSTGSTASDILLDK